VHVGTYVGDSASRPKGRVDSRGGLLPEQLVEFPAMQMMKVEL